MGCGTPLILLKVSPSKRAWASEPCTTDLEYCVNVVFGCAKHSAARNTFRDTHNLQTQLRPHQIKKSIRIHVAVLSRRLWGHRTGPYIMPRFSASSTAPNSRWPGLRQTPSLNLFAL